MSILVLSNLFGRQLTDSYHNCERIHTGPNGWEIETVFSKRKHNRERSLLDWAPAQEADFLASWQRAVSIRNFLVFLIRNPIMEIFFKKLSIRRFLIEHSVNSIGFFNKKNSVGISVWISKSGNASSAITKRLPIRRMCQKLIFTAIQWTLFIN